jgi:omega-amidase
MSLPVHLVQMEPCWEDKPAAFAKVRGLLAAAPPVPGSLVVLAEMFATGFSNRLEATQEPVDGPTSAFLRELAATWDCAVVGGLVTPGPGGLGCNQALAVAPDGRELARYTKMHPFAFGGETAVHAPGVAPVGFEWGGLRIAPLICYDLRFPETARKAVALGAEVLLYLSAWPARRVQHWLTLLQARAIENQAYVVGVNHAGRDPQFHYPGRSLVVDPHGVIIADAGDRETVLASRLEPMVVQEWRAQFPAVGEFLHAARD